MSNGGGRSAGVGLWGFGSMMAITLSWSVNHSILWMIAQTAERFLTFARNQGCEERKQKGTYDWTDCE